MKASFDTRVLCRCSECETVFRLATSQLASHAGLVRCGDCGIVFNAAWNLLDEIPNPVESSTPVEPIPSIRQVRDTILIETKKSEDGDPGSATYERFFTLDDQLHQDLQLGADDLGALEEIRQTLGPADVRTKLEERGIRSRQPAQRVPKRNATHRARLEPHFATPTQLNSDVRTGDNQQRTGRSPLVRQVRTQGLWLLATLVVVAGLFLQTRFWHFDELSAIPSARAPLESFCRFANCRVPAPLTGPAFRVLQTRVDLDPQLPGAVIVKVHLANRTTNARPYPAIQLTLTDREGQIIGKRTYMAEDYSAATDIGELPANSIVVVSLHLAGPDESAIGFEASVVKSGT